MTTKATEKGAKGKTPRKLTATEQSKVQRKANERKAITANLRRVEKIRDTLEKAVTKITDANKDLTGDTQAQVAQVLSQMGLAVTITTAEIDTQAQALARTFVR